ncbi:MAG: UV DNA damage repair endonuclease UvsE [Syntrophomonadales bacterium]|jgi:UV DNA damage endonuclease
MKIKFGYVAMSVLLKNASPSRTVTVKSFSALEEKNPGSGLYKVRKAAEENLDNSLRLLKHNAGNSIAVYRFSSKLIPLATHPLLSEWDYVTELLPRFKAIGEFVKEHGQRVSFHPDHFTLINSPRQEVWQASLADLDHHCLMLEAMQLDHRSKLVIHVGGGYQNKENARARFCDNWQLLSERVRNRIVLENDDRVYTAADVLGLCQELHIPMVLDIHHFACNNEGEDLHELLPAIFQTWQGSGLPPKIHVSSPKSADQPRHHHDFVNPDDLYPFLSLAREITPELDVMVEAKQKDLAMFQLVKDLAGYPSMNHSGPASLIMA